MEQGSGVIVNVSSDAGVNGVKGGAHYAASKAALQMFTTVTAGEWGRYGIRANCVAVGRSPRSARRGLAGGQLDTASPRPRSRSAARDIRRGRLGDPFLASDAASYITGQTLLGDGGPHMGGIPDFWEAD